MRDLRLIVKPCLGILTVAMVLMGCGATDDIIVDCDAVGDRYPVCHFDKPEDLELLPDQHTLLVSQLGGMDGEFSGSLALLDTRDHTITRLPIFNEDADEIWGDTHCPSPPGSVFAPHGIHLSTRADQRLQLLVVNHGKRESIEYFEPIEVDGIWDLRWRGCTVAPPGSFLNDVVALPDGGFLATHMFPKSNPRIGLLGLDMIKGLFGVKVGHVLHWNGSAFEVMNGSQSPFPNGIQISDDGNTVFLNVYLKNEVWKLRYPDGELLGKAEITGPDNSAWDDQGRLLIASQTAGSFDMSACFSVTSGACGAEFDIVALDPDTMEAEVILTQAGAPMGAATVALQVGEALYMGSFASDRILVAPMPR